MSDVLAAEGRVTIADVSAKCLCGHEDTRIRVDGIPARWICFLAAGSPVVQGPKLRFLADLRKPSYAPRIQRRGRLTDPFWMPPLADVDELVHHASFSWSRPYEGPTTVLDRSGAHISAAAAVHVAWGPLEHTGPIRFTGDPGYYKVAWSDWKETSTPHPLGGGKLAGQRDGEVWVPHTRVQLLEQLAAAGRWPELGDMDSWTCPDRGRLDKWSKHINIARAVAIDNHGRDSEQYRAVKESFSQAVALMIGEKQAGSKRHWKGDVHRPDWAYAIKDLSAVTMWRWCDALARIAADHSVPEFAPVAIQHADELVIPDGALDLFTSTDRAGGLRPLQIDPTGKQLGTFKVKVAA